MINIIFEDKIDFYFARQRVLERLSIASTFLPSGVAPYLAPDATALGQIFWYTVEGGGHDLGRLRAIQDWFVRYQLYSVAGVAEVASVGGFPIEYQVDIDPNKLRAYGVTLGEVYSAVERSNSSVGGRIVQKANSEYLVRSTGWISSLDDVRKIVIKSLGGTPIYVSNVATVQFGSTMRRASLEKNGNEAVGGVVLMRYGENPLEVTERIKAKIQQLQAGLPDGVRIVPFYDRTALIERAIHTVTGTLREEMIVASLAILLVLWHFRSAVVVCITLPLAVLIAFIMMRLFNIPSNIMSMSGIAISIGVLVDSSIVMVENATHHLHEHFGDKKVTGDTRELVLPAMRTVGRPIFFAVIIMVISFLPIFALSGMEGRMFHPLAWTKTFAMVGVAILAITLVPALIPILIRGRIRGEEESWIVRSVIEIYKPVLTFLLNHPWPIVLLTGIIFVVGAAPVGIPILLRGVVLASLITTTWFATREEEAFRRYWGVTAGVWLLVLAPFACRALIGAIDQHFGTSWWEDSHNLFTWLIGKWLYWPLFYMTSIGIFLVPMLLIVGLLAYLRLLGRATMLVSLVFVALLADTYMSRLGSEFMPPLNEGTILDMPVTIPRASITEVADDLKARDSLLRSFPEVSLVVGKAGRAETPTDPAPPDMVETVVNLRTREHWPKRELRFDDAKRQTEAVLAGLIAGHWIKEPAAEQRTDLVSDATMFALEAFDKTTRDMSNHDYAQFENDLAPQLAAFSVKETVRILDSQGKLIRQSMDEELTAIVEALPKNVGAHLVESPDLATITNLAQQIAAQLGERGLVHAGPDLLLLSPGAIQETLRNVGEVLGIERPTFFSKLLSTIERERDERWTAHVNQFNWQLFDHAVPLYTEQAADGLRTKADSLGLWKGPAEDDAWRAALAEASAPFAKRLFLWQKDRAGLQKEMDTVCQVPGWGNIWTQPIINRVDMLATGVRTMIGVKVYGDDLTKIQKVSDQIAGVLRTVPGAADVFPDQSIGEAYLEINIDRDRAARFGVNVGDIQDVIETALGGKMITMTVEGRERFPVRIRYARAFREDEESVKNLLVSTTSTMGSSSAMAGAGSGQSAAQQTLGTMSSAASAASGGGDVNLDPFAGGMTQIPLSQIADVHIVQGPSMIKSENGLLRSYVQLNVRDRDIVGFVDEAQRVVAEKIKLPAGMYLEWSGQFEHQVRSKRTIMVIFPLVVLTIFVLLYMTYNDLWDALLMMLAVPGALAGGVLFQVLFGFNFSVAVWVGFIASFGMATQTGVVMLVYLRDALDRHGGLENIPSLASLKHIIMEGAVHRLRPKLLTEGTIIIGLAPMLWATGTGAEIMRPMAAPVLGGILVADEVIDLLLPVLFYHVRAWRWRKLRGDADNQLASKTQRTSGVRETSLTGLTG
ncbi:MAG TPA: efflux RND transporter permease subunit [Lacipirellulaceae bacterium]